MAYETKNLNNLGQLKKLALRAKAESDAAKQQAVAAAQQAAAAFHAGKVEGSTIHFYTAAAPETPAFSVNLPAEYFLDQVKTVFVPNFAWSEETYPGSVDPSLEGKPVMVLAIKGDAEGEENDTIAWSFLDMAALVDTYKAKGENKDGTTTVTVAGYEIDVAVNLSADAGNALTKGSDGGLYVASPKVEGATEGNFAALDAEGGVVDSGLAVATDEEVEEMLNEVFGTAAQG